MARMEEYWLDQEIPALGGRSPREAVEDPIGREEVRQLLARIPPAVARDAGDDGRRTEFVTPSASTERRIVRASHRPPANVSRPVRTSRRTGATWQKPSF